MSVISSPSRFRSDFCITLLEGPSGNHRPSDHPGTIEIRRNCRARNFGGLSECVGDAKYKDLGNKGHARRVNTDEMGILVGDNIENKKRKGDKTREYGSALEKTR